MTDREIRLAAIRATAEALSKSTGRAMPETRASVFLDALSPEGRITVARYLLGDAIKEAWHELATESVAVAAAERRADPNRRLISLDRLADHIADVCVPGGTDWEGAARGLEFLLYSDGYEITRRAPVAPDDMRRRWHAADTDHDQPFEDCPSRICRGELPVPS